MSRNFSIINLINVLGIFVYRNIRVARVFYSCVVFKGLI